MTLVNPESAARTTDAVERVTQGTKMPPNQDANRRIDHTRRTALRAISLAGLAAVGSVAAAADARGRTFPEVVPLPTGFQPEGIVTGRGHEFFVGSLAGGAIYRGDLRTGAGALLVPSSDGRVAVGLSYDRRSNRLFVAGGPTGRAFVYDANTGATVADYELTSSESFVNDVVVTPTAAYFTDSFRSFLYRVPLGPAGAVPAQSAVEEIPLGGEFEAIPGAFNANGIDAAPSGAFLLVVNTSTGLLYRVDPDSGQASEIDLGGDNLTAGDGILLDGRTLYVVRNQFDEIAVVALEPGRTQGEVVRVITDPRFDVPTTVAEFGSYLYAVNARFGTSNPENAEYSVIRVPK